jgi:MoaA/NifB/PqqE/SkfB family radical SAM enzyme
MTGSDDFEPGREDEQGLVDLGGVGVEGYSPETLRRAVDVTSRDEGDQVEIQLGHFCSNRCVFCVSGQLTERGLAPPIPQEQILAAIEAAAGRKVRRLTLLGGEPTLLPGFLPSLRRAVELGFEEIVIFTNGARTDRRRFMEEVTALGRFTWRFSVQGGDAATHDHIVGRAGAFERLMAGMRWLHERGHRLTANTCLCGSNHASLPLLPALLIERGVRQHHVDLVRPSGAGVRTDEELRDLLPRLSELGPSLASMLAAAEALDADWDVNVGNVPWCALPGWEHRVHHFGRPTTTVTTDDRGRLSRVWRKFRYQRTGMVHPEPCDRCAMRDRCRGVAQEYVGFYGVDELQPIDAPEAERIERLRERMEARRGPPEGPDPDRRALLLALKRARRLRAAAPFAGWSWAGSTSEEGGLVVRLSGEGADAVAVHLAGSSVRFELVGATSQDAARSAVEAVVAALSGADRAGPVG